MCLFFDLQTDGPLYYRLVIGWKFVKNMNGLDVRNYNLLSQPKPSTFERTGYKSILIANMYRPLNSTTPLRYFFEELMDVIANVLTSTSSQLIIPATSTVLGQSQRVSILTWYLSSTCSASLGWYLDESKATT